MAKVKTIPGPPATPTARVKLLSGVIVGPNLRATKGEIYELPKYEAKELVDSELAEYTAEGDPVEHDETPPGAPA